MKSLSLGDLTMRSYSRQEAVKFRNNASEEVVRGLGVSVLDPSPVSGPLLATSGHFATFTPTHPRHLALTESEGLRWYRSSATARREFCGICGWSQFWALDSGERFSIAAGTLDPPTELETAAHVFVEDSGDYYRIVDGLPQRAEGNHGITTPADWSFALSRPTPK